MAIRWQASLPVLMLAALALPLAAQAPQTPARDTSARPQDAPPTPTGRINGRVAAADTGRPIKRARVFINAAELPCGRGALTDDAGMLDFTELPAGRYTINVSKAGF